MDRGPVQTPVVMLSHSLGFQSPLFLTANHCSQFPEPPPCCGITMWVREGRLWPLLIHGRVANYSGRATHSQRSGLPLRHCWSSGQQ